MKKMLVLLLGCFTLISCGPIIGQLMKADEGIKRFDIKGNLSELKQGTTIMVVGPFAKSGKGYYIARGDDAAFFDDEFFKTKKVDSFLYMGSKYGDLAAEKEAIKNMSTEELQRKHFGKEPPRFILFGTITGRDTIVAPTRGIIMEVSYQLEFFDRETKQTTTIDASVKAPFNECTRRLVQELYARVGIS